VTPRPRSDVMCRIKRLVDPEGLLNPGVLINLLLR
jgi:FAD/FMN-containing dehydrogenase